MGLAPNTTPMPVLVISHNSCYRIKVWT